MQTLQGYTHKNAGPYAVFHKQRRDGVRQKAEESERFLCRAVHESSVFVYTPILPKSVFSVIERF